MRLIRKIWKCQATDNYVVSEFPFAGEQQFPNGKSRQLFHPARVCKVVAWHFCAFSASLGRVSARNDVTGATGNVAPRRSEIGISFGDIYIFSKYLYKCCKNLV